MAKFSVIPKDGGTARYSGTPTFTGTYMKPGMLEFREVASPTPIDFTAGDYVVYSRTGLTYRLYNVPQLKKQARNQAYGGAFVYQSVQFFDDSKQLEICPFRDLVTGDNRIHFSTQPSISTFEGVDGIARRLQACLDDMYPGQWLVRLATTAMGASQDLVDLMAEARDFTVSGVSLLGALDKVYEVWPEVGWVFTRENTGTAGSPVWKNVITIGGGGLSTTASYVYGKGHGLNSITRFAANADELANRLFVYGSSKNMLPRWYNSQNIKDAQSVDIQNLMIPVSEWGLTDVEGTDLPDAAKAYVEDADSIARLGLRPKTYYFDGTGDLPEIYPTIREATIKAVRDALGSSSAQYYPSTTVYTDENVRVDRVLSAPSSFDSGLAGEDGKSSVSTDSSTISASDSGTAPSGLMYPQKLLFTPFYSKSVTISSAGTYTLRLSCPVTGSATTTLGYVGILMRAYILDGSNETLIGEQETRMSQTSSGSTEWTLGSAFLSIAKMTFSANQVIRFEARLVMGKFNQNSDGTYSYSFEGTATSSVSFYRAKSFFISVRQLGFDIEEQANLGDGKTIAMRSGKCAGRTFEILSCSYVPESDSWNLELARSEDESLSKWFPNTDYPIRGLENAGQSNEYPGDEFVLLDIAMPDIYVRMAENKLYAAAQDLLLDTATERWQYTPEIDAKFMVENSRTIVAGQNMALQDADIIGSSAINILVDSLTINEGESAIPTYKVTLRDRKRKTWTESESAPTTSSKSVTSSSETQQYTGPTTVAESFFELDSSGNVTLRSQYQNLWVPGWLAAGGVGTGGGGGGASYLNDLNDVTVPNPAAGDLLSWDATANSGQGAWVNVARSQVGTPVSLTNGNDYSTLTVNSVTAEFYTKSQVDSIVSNLDVNALVDITTSQDGVVVFEWSNGDTINVDLNHEHSDYVPVTRTINGVDLSQNRNFYTLGTPIAGSAANGVLYQVDGISYNPSSVSANSDLTRIEWNPNAGGTGIGAWHIKGNLYADGWIAAGGIGSGGGGGGTIFLNSSIEDVSVDTTSLSSGHILQWNGTSWVNTPLSVTANPATTTTLGGVMVGSVLSTTPIIQTISSVSDRYYYIQCDSSGLAFVNVPWTGGSGSASWGTYSSSSHTIELTVNGTSYVLCENGYSAGGGVSSESDPVFTASPAYSLDSTHVTALMSDDYALKTGGSTYNFLVNTLKFSLGTLSAENYGMTGLEEPRPKWTYTYQDNTQYPPALVTKTKYLAYKDEIPTTLKNPYALTFGSYTYDGSMARTLTAGSIGAVTLAGAETITGAKTMTANLIMGADIYPSTDLGASLGYSDHRFANGHIQTLGSTTLYLKNSTTGNNSAMLTANGGYFILRAGGNLAVSYKQLNFDETDGLYPGTTGIGLGKSANRWGDFYMSSTAKIQLGPVTIEYDSVNYALRVHGTDNNHVIGLYCDGFVAAGGVQASE